MDYRKKIIACDIDNTVANQEERFFRNYDFNKRILKSKAFSEKEMLMDNPLKNSVESINSLATNFNIIWVSARKKTWYNRTLEWLKKHNFPHTKIYLVEQNDNKLDVLEKLKPYVFIDDMKYNWENLDPKPCTNFMANLKYLSITFEIFDNNWEYIKKKYSKIN